MTVTSANPAGSLAEELEAARALSKLLKQEQDLLIAADIDNLAALVQQKASLIARMSEYAAKRLDALTQAGHAADETGMQQWLDSPACTDRNVKKAWDELLANIRAAKEMNRTNGLMIGTHMSRNQATLQVLQGNQSGQVYGRDGQTSVQASRRSLIVG